MRKNGFRDGLIDVILMQNKKVVLHPKSWTQDRRCSTIVYIFLSIYIS